MKDTDKAEPANPSREIAILEFPSNLGLIEPAPGREPGVKKLPAWLKQHGFYELLKPATVRSLDPPPYAMKVDAESGVRNADAIIRYARDQAGMLGETLEAGYFPVVVGGDCSILIGNTLALRKRGRYGLFFLDGHTDFGWPAISQTAGAAGMDLAIVTGHGHEKLVNIDGHGPYTRAEFVWCVGNRDPDPVYSGLIRQYPIHYVDLGKLRRQGIDECVGSFLAMVKEQELGGFWIHIDVDVLDDAIMPAVDCREPGGLLYEEFVFIIRSLLADPGAVGLELTILDPDLDPDGAYTKTFVEHFGRSVRGIS